MTDTTKSAARIAHEQRNAEAKAKAAQARADRIQGHKARNAVAQADALEGKAERREAARQWNAEEHYAAVAMRAMKAQTLTTEQVIARIAANDDTALPLAA